MNPFDQFDQPATQGPAKSTNPFDQFDQPDPGSVGVNRIGEILSNVGTDVKDFFVGKQDQAFANVPAIAEGDFITHQPGQKPDLSGASGLARAKVVAHDDERYHDVIKTLLGDRYIRTLQDENGFKIIELKGHDGQPVQRYINRPGMDYQDVDRTLSAAAPFLVGGALGQTAVKGAGLGANVLARAGGQGVGAVGGSIASDVAASGMGAEQDPATGGIDVTKAALAGTLGAGAELLPLPVIGGLVGGGVGAATSDGTPEDMLGRGALGVVTGAAGGRALQKAATSPKPAPVQAADEASPAMKVAAQKAGVNLDDMSPEQLRNFAEYFPAATDFKEFGTAIRANRFGLPTTKGQRTKDPELLSIEKDARYGGVGKEAKRVIDQFDDNQARAIENSAFGAFGQDIAPGQKGIADVIAPHARASSPLSVRPESVGTRIQAGLTAAKQADDDAINAAWRDIEMIYPKQEAFKDLAPAIDVRLGSNIVDDNLTPAAANMRDTLRAFMGGEEATLGSGLGDPVTRRMDLNLVRERLLAGYNAAFKSDKYPQSAKAIYHGFNDWVDDLVEKGMIVGDPANVAKLRTARGITREVKSLWEGAAGGKSPGSRIVKDVLKADTPEQVIASLLGSGGPQAAPKHGAGDALDAIKAALFKDRSDDAFSKKLALDTWNDIRLAYWSRLVASKKGEMHTPTMIVNNIQAARQNQGSMLTKLFDPDELKLAIDYSRAMKDLAYKDPNPSGTAPALRAMMRKESAAMGTVKTALQTQAKRELFSKHNVLMSRIYQLLAKNVPKQFFGTSTEGLGARVAKSAVDQRLSVKPRPVNAPLATPLAPHLLNTNGPQQN